jgi:hypothetical protein
VVGTCRSPCASCSSDPRACSSCISNYNLNGSQCLSSSNVSLILVLVGGGASPLFSVSATASETLQIGMFSINRIHYTLSLSLPSAHFSVGTAE